MKILLCDMPIPRGGKFGPFERLGSRFPPMNLLILGACLRRDGHTVRLTTDDWSMRQVAEAIRDMEPDIVGVTFMTLGSPHLPEFAAMVAAETPHAVLIAGGYHASLFPEEVLGSHPAIRAVFVGEAERTLPVFAAMCAQGAPTDEDLAKIPGLCFRDRTGEVLRTAPTELIADLDELPFPDFELIPEFSLKFRGGVNRHFLPLPQALLLTGRGCPFNCRFCGRKILGSTIRVHSTEYRLELLQWMQRRYGVRSVIYGDEFFTHDHDKTEAFCEALASRGLHRIPWVCGGRVSNMDFDFARTLRQAGCRQVAFGCESGSQTILDLLGKKVKVEKMRQAVYDTDRAGVQAFGNFMIGCPGETEETLDETYRFIMEVPLSFITLTFFTPLPGSFFWEGREYAKYGALVHDDFAKFNLFSGLPFVPFGLTENRMQAIRNRIYRDFYLRPKRLVRELRHIANPSSWRFVAYSLGLIS